MNTNSIKLSDLLDIPTETNLTIPMATIGNTAIHEESIKDENEKPKASSEKQPDKYVKVFDFLVNNSTKLRNCEAIIVSHKNVEEKKYLFYVSNDPKTGEIYQIQEIDKLILFDANCEDIFVYSGGIVTTSKTARSYILKTNTIQYFLDGNGLPQSKIIISKIPTTNEQPKYKKEENKKLYDSTEKFKMIAKNDAITLYNKIKDFQTLDSIKSESLKFLKTKKDILYLIKIENILLHTA